MYGAIIGDIVGSRFEFNNIKTKDFEFLTDDCFFTDDTLMTIAVAKALYESKRNGYNDLPEQCCKWMSELGKKYPDAGYGRNFYYWIMNDNMREPYYSYGNGSAMRTSECGWVTETIEEALHLAEVCASVSHNHPEGVKGAQAVTACIFLASRGRSKGTIREYIEANFYNLDFTLYKIRPTYEFDETCQGTVPQAIKCFLESKSFEDAIRNAISIGGDSDTIAAITGSIAEAYYQIDEELIKKINETYIKDFYNDDTYRMLFKKRR